MFSVASSPKLQGAAYGILNALRVCNVVTLLSVQVAAWVMIVMAGTTNQFYFFDAAKQFLVFIWAFFLMSTELTFVKFAKKWIHTNWPVFSYEHSFLWFGLMMMAISCHVLGSLNVPAYFVDNLGLPWWRVILAAGILSMTFGVLNIIASIIFRIPAQGVTARMLRSKGATAKNSGNAKDYYSDHNSAQMHEDDYEKEYEQPSRFKRMTRAFTKGGRFSTKPQISKPIPQNNYREPDIEEGSTRRNTWDADTFNPDDRRSPVVPDIERPPTAMHPMHSRGDASSQYSAARMSRF